MIAAGAAAIASAALPLLSSAAYVDEYDSEDFTRSQIEAEPAPTYEGVGEDYAGRGTFGLGSGDGGPGLSDEDMLRMQAKRDVRSSDYLSEKQQRYEDAVKRGRAKKQQLGQFLGQKALADPGMGLSPQERAKYRRMAEDAARRSRELAADADEAQAETDRRLQEMARTRRDRERERYMELKRQQEDRDSEIRTYGGSEQSSGGFFSTQR